jgi:hypothetical protein
MPNPGNPPCVIHPGIQAIRTASDDACAYIRMVELVDIHTSTSHEKEKHNYLPREEDRMKVKNKE